MARWIRQKRLAALHQILRTYGGEFLADFYLSDAPLFDEWVTITREQIRRQVVVAHHKLTSYALETGAVDQGIAAARQWVQVDDLNEIAHMTLIRLLLQGGKSARSQGPIRRMCPAAADRTGHGSAPGADGADPDMPRPDRQSLSTDATTVRHNLPAPHDQFFGRGNAQREIHSRLDQSWCRLVTISGQGGVGKTRSGHHHRPRTVSTAIGTVCGW